MKSRYIKLLILSMTTIFFLTSCMGEVKKKLKKAKQGVSNVTAIAETAKEAKENINKLKDAKPLTNEELKEWLPESLGGWQRSGFKVGTTGYMHVASIEGTYKIGKGEVSNEIDLQDGEVVEKKLTINIIDGAGPSGSMIIAGLGMASKMDMEEETEYKHTQGVTINGIRAQQTFHKIKRKTALQFVYENRFGVMVNGVNLDPNETWAMLENLDFEDLAKKAE